MFNNNIRELKKKNPELAQKLKGIDVNDIKDINVYEAESKDYIISYKNVMLHSAEDPMREAKAIWHKTIKTSLKENDIQVVYGLGLGYLFKRAYVEAPSKILIYEPNLEILRFVMENVDLSKELAEDRVNLVNNQEDALKYIEKKYFIGDKIEVLFLPSYINFCKDDLINLSTEIYQVVKDKNIDKNTSSMVSGQAVSNLLKRVSNPKKMLPATFLQDVAKDKQVLIFSAGPSLKKDIALIKENQNKFLKIAVFPILNYLLENDVIPDFVVTADSFPQVFKLKGLKKFKEKIKNISLICDSRADHELDNLEFKNTFLYFPYVDAISNEVFKSLANPVLRALPSGSSVALLAFETAKMMSASSIIFSGLDLAFVNNEPYADSAFKTKIEEKTLSVKMLDDSSQIRLPLVSVESASGGPIPTREDYLFHIREFEKILKNEKTDIINTSLDGALIKGMSYISMDDIIKSLKDEEQFLEPVFEEKDFDLISQYKNKACNLLQNTREDFVNLSKELPFIIDSMEEIIKELSKDSFDNEAFQELFSQNKETFAKIRNEITSNYLLSSCLHSEIIDFLSGYVKDTTLSLEKFRQNFESENKLFKQAKARIDVLLDLMEKI